MASTGCVTVPMVVAIRSLGSVVPCKLNYEFQPNHSVATYSVFARSVDLQLLVVVAGVGVELSAEVATGQKQG